VAKKMAKAMPTVILNFMDSPNESDRPDVSCSSRAVACELAVPRLESDSEPQPDGSTAVDPFLGKC
jgi:hypothetical protein